MEEGDGMAEGDGGGMEGDRGLEEGGWGGGKGEYRTGFH